MKDLILKFLGWFYSIFTKAASTPVDQSKLLEIIDRWEHLFNLKCAEVDKAIFEVAKIREERATDREIHRKLADEYYMCEESRASLMKQNAQLAAKISVLEFEIVYLRSELEKIKHAN
jgi:predicted dienelactone hydrolase